MYVWIARNEEYEDDDKNYYEIHLRKPVLCPLGWWQRTGGDEAWVVPTLCPTHFEPMTGIKLKPGDCKRLLWRSPLLPVPKRKKAAAKKG